MSTLKHELTSPALTLLSVVLSLVGVVVTWRTVVVARDAIDVTRRAGRPVLRLQDSAIKPNSGFPEIKPPPWSAQRYPEGETKVLELHFLNAGQRAASGVNINIAVYSAAGLWKMPRSPGATTNDVGEMYCPMQSVGDEILPGDSVPASCPVYVPVHEYVGITILYTDLEGDGDELCQVFALRLAKDGTISRASQFQAMALGPPNLKCSYREPAWLRRARVPPS